MLIQLNIKNLALIDELSIEFNKGLNVMTGETGAGKSIIIDAVCLILGERADRTLIRTGCDYCSVEGVFLDIGKGVKRILTELGIEYEEEQLIISRKLYSNGRNVCRINNETVTVSLLKEIGQYLVDIHGQHQHQLLLNPSVHINILDKLGSNDLIKVKSEVNKQYIKLCNINRQIKELKSIEEDSERKRDILKFQIDDINNAKIILGEDEDLESQSKILSNSERISTTLEKAYNMLYDSEEVTPINEAISIVKSDMEKISEYNKDFEYISDTLNSIYYQIEDLVFRIRSNRDSFNYDPDTLEYVEKRISVLDKLKRKYGQTLEEILSYRDQLDKELDDIDNNKEKIEELLSRRTIIVDELIKMCFRLSKYRERTAKLFEDNIIKQLSDLNMKKTIFSVLINKPDTDDIDEILKNVTEDGYDKIEFMIATNPGEPVKSLAKTVSGGEMSRIMLAIKTVLAEKDDIQTLIFDEIDTGISGFTGNVVGQKMAHIAITHQIICVTHLAQIAVMADSHFKIEKLMVNDRTKTTVTQLSSNEREKEIARIVGGSQNSKISRDHAKELIKEAQINKKNNKKAKN